MFVLCSHLFANLIYLSFYFVVVVVVVFYVMSNLHAEDRLKIIILVDWVLHTNH